MIGHDDVAGGDLQTPKNQPAAPTAFRLSVIASKDGYRPPEPGQARRYYLRAAQEQLPLFSGDHELGHSQGAKVAAAEYDARGLLRRSVERGRYLDNIFIERLWCSLKQEAIYLE